MICPFWRDLDNLGDRALNAWLLPRLFPGLGPYHGPADRLLFGIGSLFGNDKAKANLPRHQRTLPRIVFTTGAYGREALPPGSEVICVRGRFTCEMIGVSHRLAVADGAILLPDYLPLEHRPRFETVTVEKCEWTGHETNDHFCTRVGHNLAGFVRQLLTFRRVATHSLHAAIIADAYGVPWLPLRWEPKWSDHFSQLGIRRQPTDYTLSPRSALTERRQQLRERVIACRSLLARSPDCQPA